jgi:hypothetical protein
MFLGGPLDHAVRQVVARPGASPRPDHEDYFADVRGEGKVRYRLGHVVVGPYRWWTYICVGHTPSPRDLLDAAPTKVFLGSPR